MHLTAANTKGSESIPLCENPFAVVRQTDFRRTAGPITFTNPQCPRPSLIVRTFILALVLPFIPNLDIKFVDPKAPQTEIFRLWRRIYHETDTNIMTGQSENWNVCVLTGPCRWGSLPRLNV